MITFVKMTTPNRIRGGIGDRVPYSAVSKKQMKMGVKVEMEHTNKPSIAKEIAKDHLTEFPDYYTHLNKMEKKMTTKPSGWKRQSKRHREAYYKGVVGRVSPNQRTVGSGFLHRHEDLSPFAQRVMVVATPEQKEVFRWMDSGDETFFLNYLHGEITPQSIDNALQLMVNNVEGAISQLPGALVAYARPRGWLSGWENTPPSNIDRNQSWEFPSRSHPDMNYVVKFDERGQLTCTCPSWVYNTRRQQPRTCKHTDEVNMRIR